MQNNNYRSSENFFLPIYRCRRKEKYSNQCDESLLFGVFLFIDWTKRKKRLKHREIHSIGLWSWHENTISFDRRKRKYTHSIIRTNYVLRRPSLCLSNLQSISSVYLKRSAIILSTWYSTGTRLLFDRWQYPIKCWKKISTSWSNCLKYTV